MTNEASTVWILIFWVSLTIPMVIGFIYFRDLGDVTQMVVRARRENMLHSDRVLRTPRAGPGWSWAFFWIISPAVIGNILGVALFAAMPMGYALQLSRS